MTQQPLYSCKYCKKKFFTERTFIKHECTAMLRSREIQTAVGQQAYGLYKVWLEKQRRKPPPVEGFISSAYYSGFIKFAQWTRETGIPDPEKYVELMVNSKISPSLWRRSEAYQIFLEWSDRKSDPYDQMNNTIETILTLAEGLEIPPGQVFSKFTSGEIAELIHQKRLSPWLLFCSKSFKDWISKLHDGERQDLMKSIGIDYWSQRLEKAPEVVKNGRLIAEELGI
jgi:hypothetical protein